MQSFAIALLRHFINASIHYHELTCRVLPWWNLNFLMLYLASMVIMIAYVCLGAHYYIGVENIIKQQYNERNS